MRNLIATSVLALSALTLSAPVLADEAAAPALADAAKPAKPKKICREAPDSSSSRLATGRTCRTQAQWDEIDANGTQSSSRAVHSFRPDT